MKKQSAEDYLDKLLNSVNGDDEEISTFDMDVDTKLDIEAEEMVEPQRVSRRVSKSEEEFLKEFEAELEADDFDDFLKKFEDEEIILDDVSYKGAGFVYTDVLEEESPVMETPVEELPDGDSPFNAFFGNENIIEEPMVASEPITDSFDLGGVDLGALLNEAAGEDVPVEQPIEQPVEQPMEEDMFSNLFGGGAETAETVDFGSLFGGDGEATDAVDFGNLFGSESETTEAVDFGNLFGSDEDSSGSLDLGNLGEADLMSLLSGDGDLSDLGDMLSQGDSSDFAMGELDAFAAFAENEMSLQSDADTSSDKKDKKKSGKKKGGLLDKIKELLLSEDDEDEVELKVSKAPDAGQLSDENAEILAEMDAEDKGAKGNGGFFGKLKKDKAGDDKKPKKEKKPKAPKPKKEKKPKAPKPKKEKKPKEVDNTPPLPKGPVMMIWVMALSLLGFVYLGTNLVSYASYVNEARSYYNTGNYAEAYEELLGLTLKEKDMELYNQVATLATVDSELNAYKAFLLNEDYTKALDSLVCAAGRCELNEDSADVYGCLGQMEILKKTVSNELNTYGMTYEQALEMYHIKDREDYTIALYTKLKELGLE